MPYRAPRRVFFTQCEGRIRAGETALSVISQAESVKTNKYSGLDINLVIAGLTSLGYASRQTDTLLRRLAFSAGRQEAHSRTFFLYWRRRILFRLLAEHWNLIRLRFDRLLDISDFPV